MMHFVSIRQPQSPGRQIANVTINYKLQIRDDLDELVHWRRFIGRGSNENVDICFVTTMSIFYFGSNVSEEINQINIHTGLIIV